MTPQPKARVLLVEDDQAFGRAVARMLRDDGYEAQHAITADDARRLAAEEQFQLAICDLRLPGGGGLELIGELRKAQPDVAVVIATGVSAGEVAEQAFDRGAYGYLVKPFENVQLLITARNALQRRELEIYQREYEVQLERTVTERTAELEAALAEVTASRDETIKRLMAAIELRDNETGGHIERIGTLSRLLAGWIGLSDQRAREIGFAAPMHDIGKIGVPDRILLKPEGLDSLEREQMQLHAELGSRLLDRSPGALLRLAATIARTHHEWFDGSGYPEGLAGTEIPLEGRIVAVADVFDAIHSDRVYRPAMDRDEAEQMMRDGRDTQFDPEILDALVDHYDEALAVIDLGKRWAATISSATSLYSDRYPPS